MKTLLLLTLIPFLFGFIVLKDKRTGKYVNDFQQHATPETLIDNAVKADIGSEDYFEVEEVDADKFEDIKKDTLKLFVVEAKAKKQADESRKKDVLVKLGLTAEELKYLLQ